MNLRSTIGMCVIIVGAFSLTSCQPPTPRIVRVEALSHAVVISSDATAKTVLSAFDRAGQVIQVYDLDGLPTNSSKRFR